MNKIILYGLLVVCTTAVSFSQGAILPDSIKVQFPVNNRTDFLVPTGALKKIELLDFKNTDIKDVIRGIAKKYDLNIFVENDINQRITLRLTNVRVGDALRFITKENGLKLILDKNIYKIIKPVVAKPKPKPLVLSYADGLLSLDLNGEDVRRVVRAINEVSGRSIVMERNVQGKLTGYLKKVPFEEGLITLMKSNGFSVHKKDNIYIIASNYFSRKTEKSPKGSFWIGVKDSLITLDIIGGDLNKVIFEISNQLGVNVFTYSILKGKINAHCKDVPFEKVLDYLFRGTNYTYRREGNVYFIGDKSISGIASIQLIPLKHIKVEGIIDVLPPSITSKATLKIVKEHNALMVVGTQEVIDELKEFIRKIDYPIPQILIEAILVDFTTSDIGESGLTAWMKAPGDTNIYADTFFPTLNVTASAKNLNKSIQFYGAKFGIGRIGRLPSNFMLNLKALESQGKVNIRSHPQIATLNGHPASIKIGTTQYYKMESERPIVGGNQVFNQVTQRFEKITAEMSLTITPWVSASGEITTEIKPEFSTPRGFNPKIPPTIDHRILESTVRLHDGETIVLGGLIQTNDSENVEKFPILGDIPILGRLFQNRSRKHIKSKLMIYITPHLVYSDELNGSQGIIR